MASKGKSDGSQVKESTDSSTTLEDDDSKGTANVRPSNLNVRLFYPKIGLIFRGYNLPAFLRGIFLLFQVLCTIFVLF